MGAYLRDDIEHDSQQQVSAVGFLCSLCFILEEGELVLDKVPAWHMIDVVEQDEEIKCKDKPLHSVNRRDEHLLQVLRCFGSFWKYDCVSEVDESQCVYESDEAGNKHDRVVKSLEPD